MDRLAILYDICIWSRDSARSRNCSWRNAVRFKRCGKREVSIGADLLSDMRGHFMLRCGSVRGFIVGVRVEAITEIWTWTTSVSYAVKDGCIWFGCIMGYPTIRTCTS